MELSGLNSLYLDNIRSSALMNGAAPVHSPENFADVLRRTSANQHDNSFDDVTSAARRRAQAPIDKTDKLYELCLELETFLIKNLLTSMRNTVQKSDFIDEGFAGKIYEDMLYNEYAKSFAKNAGFGLAEQAYRQLMNI